MGGLGVWELLVILAIVLLLFGTKKLRRVGSDLGQAFKGFKTAIKDESESDSNSNRGRHSGVDSSSQESEHESS